MCPPYCNECISPLRLRLASVSRRWRRRRKKRRGGWGVSGYSSEEKGSVWWWKNSVLWSHLSCQRADTDHPGTRGLWCSESGHWPRFIPPPPLLHLSPSLSLLQHLIYKIVLSRPISSVLYCHPGFSELPFFYCLTNTPSSCSARLPLLFMLSCNTYANNSYAKILFFSVICQMLHWKSSTTQNEPNNFPFVIT